jgi:hypothetical protein
VEALRQLTELTGRKAGQAERCLQDDQIKELLKAPEKNYALFVQRQSDRVNLKAYVGEAALSREIAERRSRLLDTLAALKDLREVLQRMGEAVPARERPTTKQDRDYLWLLDQIAFREFEDLDSLSIPEHKKLPVFTDGEGRCLTLLAEYLGRIETVTGASASADLATVFASVHNYYEKIDYRLFVYRQHLPVALRHRYYENLDRSLDALRAVLEKAAELRPVTPKGQP